MKLYQYFKAISQNKNRMANPVIIAEDEVRQLASITYNQVSPQFSWDIPYMLSARGLVIDMITGDIVARPYPKFFNYGENERAKWPENISSITVEEKLDGSEFDAGLIVAATTNFDWKSQQLLDHHKASDGKQLIRKLLLAGEISSVTDKIMEVSGYNNELEEIEDIKN